MEGWTTISYDAAINGVAGTGLNWSRGFDISPDGPHLYGAGYQ